jgi:formamidopyrimidine-DNA glycosylase
MTCLALDPACVAGIDADYIAIAARADASPRIRVATLARAPPVRQSPTAARADERRGNALPEYPDLTIYVEALQARLLGEPLEKIRFSGPALLKSVAPRPSEIEGLRVTGIERLGKRLVFGLESEVFAVLHLMVAGRLHWKKRGVAIPRKRAHAAFDFPQGSLLLTEASTKKRASLHLVRGREALEALDPGGIEVFAASASEFRDALERERHTLKRSLTDPHLFAGIGNAYSDEILHRARLSPIKMSDRLTPEEVEGLRNATLEVLEEWTQRLRRETGDDFPEKVTAFRPEMAVHGKFREPCPVCGAPIQRIVRAENEVNYCPGCQTDGRILADRALSRLLGKDWPRSLEELEKRRPGPDGGSNPSTH